MSITTVLYKNKTLSNGRYAVRLRLYFGREHFISLGESALPSEWNERTGRFTSRADNFESRNVYLSKKEREGRDIINSLGVFSFEEFKKRFVGVATSVTVNEFVQELIDELKQKGKIGNSNKYKQLQHMLARYKASSFTFLDVTYTFLVKFEAFLLQRGSKNSNVHFYMRTLRAVINESIRRGLMEKEAYPFATQFNKSGYSFAHLKGDFNPKPLALDELEAVKQFDVDKYPALRPAFDLFMFLIRARGINFVDVCELTLSNIQEGRLRYVRQKTGKLYSIKITPEMRAIIDRYKGEKYLFPILDDAPLDKEKRYTFIRERLRMFNEHLKDIARICKVKDITSYTARYSYTNVLVRNGVSLPLIQQALGHSNLATTQHYVQKYADSEVDKVDDLI